MSELPMWKTLLPLCLGAVITQGCVLILWEWWNRSRSATTPAKSPSTAAVKEQVNAALIFPEPELPCRFYYKQGFCRRVNCEYSHDSRKLSCLMEYLNRAKRNLDICVYMITSHELCSAVKSISRRGVEVRVITDGSYGEEDRTRIGELRAEGIAIRSNLPGRGTLMHHKFAIVDGTLLMNGSFNWTWQAIVGNHENLLITNNWESVSPFIEEFNRLWKEFDPSSQTAQLQFD